MEELKLKVFKMAMYGLIAGSLTGLALDEYVFKKRDSWACTFDKVRRSCSSNIWVCLFWKSLIGGCSDEGNGNP